MRRVGFRQWLGAVPAASAHGPCLAASRSVSRVAGDCYDVQVPTDLTWASGYGRSVKSDPLVVPWQGRQVRVRHDHPCIAGVAPAG